MGTADELFGNVVDLPRQPLPSRRPAEDRRPGEGDAAAAEDDLRPYASRVGALTLPGVHVQRRGKPTRSFQYTHMGYKECAADGCSFVVEFNEPEKWCLTVDGQRLWEIYNYLTQHRLEWIREADRPFAPPGERVILSVRIEPVKEEGR